MAGYLGLEDILTNYQVLRNLGEGGFSQVVLARHVLTGTEVAIKIVDKGEQAMCGCWSEEVDCLTALRHPHIIELYEVLDTEEHTFLVMEHAEGGSLQDYLEAHGPLTEREACAKFQQLVSALSHCHHQGIAHLDLKPDNILLDGENNIKLADFGLSLECANSLLYRFCGTVGFIAPEAYLLQCYDGRRMDMWSLGVVLYILLTGSMPFVGNDIWELRQKILKGEFHLPENLSEECQDLIKRLMTLNPWRRITIDSVMQHPWVHLTQESPAIREPSSDDLNPAITEVMENMGYTVDEIKTSVEEKKYNSAMGTYLMLLRDWRTYEGQVISGGPSVAEPQEESPASGQCHAHPDQREDAESSASHPQPRTRTPRPGRCFPFCSSNTVEAEEWHLRTQAANAENASDSPGGRGQGWRARARAILGYILSCSCPRMGTLRRSKKIHPSDD